MRAHLTLLCAAVCVFGCGGRTPLSGELQPAPQPDPPAPVPVAGGCTSASPTILASGQDSPSAIAVDSSAVYWIDTGSRQVMSADLCGTAVTTLVVSTDKITGIAIDDTNVYFLDLGGTQGDGPITAMAVPKAGGTTRAIASTTGYVGPEQEDPIAVDDTSVYFAANEATLANGTIVSAPKSGGSVTVLATGQWNINTLLVDSTNVYWSSTNGDSIFGAVSSCLKTGGPTDALVVGMTSGADVAGFFAIALDAGYVYVPEPAAVARIPKGGGAVELITTTQSLQDNVQTGIAVDSSHVYWVETPGEASVIHVATAAGGPDATLVSAATGDEASGVRLAVDATSVYWTSYGTGTVMRAPK